MSDSMTPEERLLKLIRGEKTKKTETGDAADLPDKNAAKKTGVVKHAALKFRFGAKKQTVLQAFNPDDLVRHAEGEVSGAQKIMTRTLIAILAAVWGYIVWQLLFHGELAYEQTRAGEDKGETQVNGPWSVERPELAVYLNPVANRDLFKAFEPEKPVAEAPKGPKLEEIIARMSLLGIILDEKPQAIVQDRKTQATHYVHVGDSIDAVVVEEIKEGVVKFSYQGESFELRI